MGNSWRVYPQPLARGKGLPRVEKADPYPYPSVPYPKPAWVLKPLTITNRTDSHTIPYPSQGVPLMAGSGFLANNDSEQVLVCVGIDISTLLLIFTHQHTFVTFDNVEKY